jgi:hypothetical protein
MRLVPSTSPPKPPPPPNQFTMRPAAMPPLPTYAVYSDNTSDGSHRMWDSPKSLHLALENVRVIRNHIINPFADPAEVDSILPIDATYLCCNQIGPLHANAANHWGYRFSHFGKDVSVWIQKVPITPGGAMASTLQADLARPVMALEVQRTTVGWACGIARYY